MSRNFTKENKEHSIEVRLPLTSRACAEFPVPRTPPADPNRELHVASETRANPRVWPREAPRRGLDIPPAPPHLIPAVGAHECLDEGVGIIRRTLPILDFADTSVLR